MAVISIKNKTKSGSLLNGNAPFIPNDYESIATVTVGSGGSSTITFSSIPSTYQHLQIRAIGIGTGFNYAGLNFNSDTASNYSYHQLYGNGSSALADAGANSSVIYTLQGGTSATFPAIGVIDILDYANTNKNKTVRSLSGYDQNGAGEVYFRSGDWRSTSAVTSIQITGSTSFAQYTQFALYGIKG
jgi:hypothetical protein